MSRRLPVPGRLLALMLTCAGIAAVFLLWNLHRSPDTQYDEVVYSRADQAVAENWSLTWTNRPLFVHTPLSFLAQAGWLRILGTYRDPLIDVIADTRLLAAFLSVANVVLIAMLTYRLADRARPRARLVLTVVTAALASLDPVLLRFGRMAMIEPFALFACLVTLHLAMALQARRSRWFVAVVGLAGGLTLLTNEVGIFMLLTPLVHALLARDRRFIGRCLAALAAALALWCVFVVWAVQLGLFASFVEIKSVTLQRLLGTVQITGWNRPGVSFVSGLSEQVNQYAAAYLILALGAVAAVWLMLRRGGDSARWLLAWLITSYAFGAYTVLLGTLNEQFFVYVVPASLVGTVLVADAVLGARRWSASVAWVLLGAVLILGTSSWGRFYTTRNDGLARLTAYVGANLPACAALNATGDAERFEQLFPNRPITDYATGPGALSHGVTLFVLSDKDAGMRFGNSSPQLAGWVRGHGTRLAAYPSATYRGLELWRVGLGTYDRGGVERLPGGDFVVTEGSRCGGHAVVDGSDGAFATGWRALGGKTVAGAPLTGSWSAGDGYQVFAGAVLAGATDAAGSPRMLAEPLVADLARVDPGGYRRSGLPPLDRAGAPRAPITGAIAAAYRGGAGALLGEPLGRATVMPDGQVRQAFAGGVLEHGSGSSRVRLAPIGGALLDAGLVTPPADARQPDRPPPLPTETEPAQPTTVQPFFWTLLGVLAGYLLVAVLLVRRRRSEPLPPAPSPTPGTTRSPALGELVPVSRRATLVRAGALTALLAAALVVRAGGFLHEEPSTVPALPQAAAIAPGVVRTGQPAEADLVRLHDDYGVRGIIAIDGRDDSTLSDDEEEAAAESVGIQFLSLTSPEGAALSAGQVSAVASLLHRTRSTGPPSPNLVLLHDRTGDGPVVLLGAAVRILGREDAGEVLASTPELTAAERRSLADLAAAVKGNGGANNPYAALRVADR
ncbi:glycosyltransferase family 39 protein [Actinoplanes sp. M2I2]|uniref:glycosyltransferase family 39 protein n=1 Tax=Actinoplanes sp. M2I2 TaxID=1734444 RepID=UPI002020B8C8|nr:glycosyltransferase family 39 protein [Actinoplanes sp. M2I2]